MLKLKFKKLKKLPLRVRIGMWLIGPFVDTHKMSEELYQSIWPKHDFYEAKNRALIRTAITRAVLEGMK